jgi:hypothetical protein
LFVLMVAAAARSLPLWIVASNGVVVASGRMMLLAAAAERYARSGSRLASVGSSAEDHVVPGGSGGLCVPGAVRLCLGRCGMTPVEVGFSLGVSV